MDHSTEFEYLRALSYLFVPLALAWLVPKLDGSRQHSAIVKRLWQVLILLATILIAAYTYLFLFSDVPEEQRVKISAALPPLPGIVWCLLIVYLAHYFADKFAGDSAAAGVAPQRLPVTAWAALGISWLLAAGAVLALLPLEPALASYGILALGFAIVAGGPAILASISGRLRITASLLERESRTEQARMLAWQIFAVLGIMAFGKIALAAVVTLDRAATRSGATAGTSMYTDLILATLCCYAASLLLLVTATRRRAHPG